MAWIRIASACRRPTNGWLNWWSREIRRVKFRVQVVWVQDDGSERCCDVMELERQQLVRETLGLSVAEGKAILHGVQEFVTTQQAAQDLRRRRQCPHCVERYQSQEAGMHPVNTVFGPVAVPHPRWHRCACQTEGPKTFRPTAVWLRGRTSPELLYLETKWGSWIPFERVADLLKEVLPVGDSTNSRDRPRTSAGDRRADGGRTGRRTAVRSFPTAERGRGTAAAGWPHHRGDGWRLRASGPPGGLV